LIPPINSLDPRSDTLSGPMSPPEGSRHEGGGKHLGLTEGEIGWYSGAFAMRGQQARGVIFRGPWFVFLLFFLLLCDLTAHAAAPVGTHARPSRATAPELRSSPAPNSDSPLGAAHHGSCVCQHGHCPFLSAGGSAFFAPPTFALTEWASSPKSTCLLQTEPVIRSPPLG